MNLSKPPFTSEHHILIPKVLLKSAFFGEKTRLSNGNIEMDFLFLMPMVHAMRSPTDAKKLTSL